MCRWMAWHGQPMLIEELLIKPQHSLIDQSMHSRLGAEATNGDGFGIGWYGTGAGPGRYRNTEPAWSDQNLRELAAHVETPLFLAHVRATSGSAVQQTNCHPFRHGHWLFVHNGLIHNFHAIRRELMLALTPPSFDAIEGSTDSEVLLQLAVTFGLESDPLGALERAIGHVEQVAREHGIDQAVQASIGVSDGRTLWALRYATDGHPRTLFASGDVETLQRLHPEREGIRRMHEGDHIVVSEPIVDLEGAWVELEPGSALTISPDGTSEQRAFVPALRA